MMRVVSEVNDRDLVGFRDRVGWNQAVTDANREVVRRRPVRRAHDADSGPFDQLAEQLDRMIADAAVNGRQRRGPQQGRRHGPEPTPPATTGKAVQTV